jgi:cytochrome c-type biogenesis protein CcmH/NrfG
MAWLAAILLALLAVGALWTLAGLRGAAVQFVLAALLIGLAGYAWQGRPGLAGTRSSDAAAPPIPETPFTGFRKEIFGAFDTADRWLTIAEGRLRRGSTADAVGAIRSGLRAHPQNATLWTGYGNALMLHAGGLSPAADLAFRRAVALAPRHPGPPLFYGMALVQARRIDEAEAMWRRALALASPKAPWREGLEEQLRLIDEAQAGAATPAPAPAPQPPQ